MATCERCWEMAHSVSRTSNTMDQADVYRELLLKNDCTPEQQAGRAAVVCPTCKTRTVHQHTHQCVACGFSTKTCGPKTEET